MIEKDYFKALEKLPGDVNSILNSSDKYKKSLPDDVLNLILHTCIKLGLVLGQEEAKNFYLLLKSLYQSGYVRGFENGQGDN
jgi:hypothetical protein